MRNRFFVFAAVLLVFLCFQPAAFAQGSLNAADKDGKSLGACPLKNTDVKVEISGFLARVRVRQEFENNFTEKIEAVYVFPLSNKAAVDAMTMTVGTRIVKGKIMRREEARDVYEAAKNNGQVAALLDQERPNIFTQSVANILPSEKVTVEISYVETLNYDAGTYEFVFPTVVAPRYNPAQVADANKIAPPVAATRAGHDISIEVALDAGVPIEAIESKSHQIQSNNLSPNRAVVRLKNEKEIPNKDFVLRYDVSGKKIADAVLTHKSDKGGFFTLILQPPDNPPAADVTPKEIVFVLDTSGSMSGFSIEKAKEAMKLALDGLYPNDTFNLITFAGDTHILFDEPVPATRENLAKAQAFLAERKGGGGTEMMKAIKVALDPTDSKQHLRVVCFMTDGEVGNDAEIIAEVQKHQNARVFSFGIGSSINRHLLDKIAEEGRGEAQYIALDDDGSAAARRFHERVRAPLLTDVSIDWNGLPVADVYPNRLQDLFSAKPVIVHGRFTNAAKGTIRLHGKQAGQEIVREIAVNFPENEPAHDTLATLWARSRVDDLTKQDYENNKPEIKETITNLGLEFRLLTAFTSFVAVEELVTTEGGQPRRVDVPIELPAGMNRQAGFTDASNNFLRRENLPINGRRFQDLVVNKSPATGGGNVTQDRGVQVDATDTKVQTSITTQRIESLPKGTNVTSALRTTAAARGEALSGGFQIDGGSGSENSFIVDGQETNNFRTDVLTGKALNLPEPVIPPNAHWKGKNGTVRIKVEVDENGRVFSATAAGSEGHPFLRAASTSAARNSTFVPVKINEKAVRTTGEIVYKFAYGDKKINVLIEFENFAVKLSPEEQKQRELAAKVSPTIFALVERLKDSKIQPAADEIKFVSNGKAEIRVSLADKTPAAIEELKVAGFELVLDPTTTKFVTGRIAVEKLAALAELRSVIFIAPQLR